MVLVVVDALVDPEFDPDVDPEVEPDVEPEFDPVVDPDVDPEFVVVVPGVDVWWPEPDVVLPLEARSESVSRSARSTSVVVLAVARSF